MIRHSEADCTKPSLLTWHTLLLRCAPCLNSPDYCSTMFGDIRVHFRVFSVGSRMGRRRKYQAAKMIDKSTWWLMWFWDAESALWAKIRTHKGHSSCSGINGLALWCFQFGKNWLLWTGTISNWPGIHDVLMDSCNGCSSPVHILYYQQGISIYFIWISTGHQPYSCNSLTFPWQRTSPNCCTSVAEMVKHCGQPRHVAHHVSRPIGLCFLET